MRSESLQPGNRAPAFDAAEYRSRQDRTKQAMVSRGLDALLVVEPANVNWLTGYEARSFYTPKRSSSPPTARLRSGSAAPSTSPVPDGPPT